MLDTEVMGFGLCSVGSTAWACDFDLGAPGTEYSCTLKRLVSTIGGVRKSMSGSVGAGEVTAGATLGLKISDKAVNPADILYLSLLRDDILKDHKLVNAVGTFSYSERKHDIAILESI